MTSYPNGPTGLIGISLAKPIPIVDETVRAGNYAIATAKTRPWLSTPIVASTTKSRRTKSQVQIVYPLFSECAAITTDPFWSSIFSNAAKGTFPRGFTYYHDESTNSRILTYKRGVKTWSTEVPSDPAEAIVTCVGFFARTAGIMSESDQERTKQEYDRRMLEQTSIRASTWSEIKKKKIRDILIGTFVQDIVKAFELTDKESDQLSTTISVGFLLGFFQSKNVHFEQGRIKGIIGLMYDADTRTFFIDPSLTPKISKTSKSRAGKDSEDGDTCKESVSFLNLWVKFIEGIEKSASKNEATRFQSALTPSFSAARSPIAERSPVLPLFDEQLKIPPNIPIIPCYAKTLERVPSNLLKGSPVTNP